MAPASGDTGGRGRRGPQANLAILPDDGVRQAHARVGAPELLKHPQHNRLVHHSGLVVVVEQLAAPRQIKLRKQPPLGADARSVGVAETEINLKTLFISLSFFMCFT